MVYVCLTNNTVTDVARVNPHDVFNPSYAALFIEAPDEVTHGWTYLNGVFEAPPAQTPTTPPGVTMRQARLALLQAGKLADVEAAIAALSSPAKEAAQIEWEYATEVKRDSTLVSQLAPALNLDAAALDALFTQAATL